MKKGLGLLLIVVLLVGAFSACGGTGTNSASNDNPIQTPVATPVVTTAPFPSPIPPLAPDDTTALVGQWVTAGIVARRDLIELDILEELEEFGETASQAEIEEWIAESERWIKRELQQLISIEFFPDGTGLAIFDYDFESDFFWSADRRLLTFIELDDWLTDTFDYEISGSRLTIYGFMFAADMTFERVS